MPTRYIVHANDPTTNQRTTKVFEAENAGDAEKMGQRLGLSVLAVEVDPAGLGATIPTPSIPPVSTRQLGPESQVWVGTPSQWVNTKWYAACILVIPAIVLSVLFPPFGFASLILLLTIPVAAWKWLVIRTTKYSLSTQRLRLESGVLTKSLDEVELYRVKDTQLHQTVVDRALGIGSVLILSSDETMPQINLAKVPDPVNLREKLRAAVEQVRLARGVREIDITENRI
ncbi:MAG: PH domain-containing protein [Phycisphaerae bacterium]|nr:PH domain-containing protein [Phycisphaerae bacterium]